MPIAPVERAMMEESVGVPSPNANTTTAQAVQGLVGTLYQNSSKIYTQIKQAEASTAVAKQKAQDKLETNDYRLNLLTRSKDGYAVDENGDYKINPEDNSRVTLSQEFSEWTNERFKINQTKMPSKLAQEAYIKEGQEFFTAEQSAVRSEEQVKLVEGILVAHDEITRANQHIQANGINMGAALDAGKTVDTLIDTQVRSGIINNVIGQKTALKSNNEVASSLVEMAIVNVMKSSTVASRALRIKQLEDLLMDIDKEAYKDKDGKIIAKLYDPKNANNLARSLGNKTLAQMLDPENRIRYLAQLKELKERAHRADISELQTERAQKLAEQKEKGKNHLARLTELSTKINTNTDGNVEYWGLKKSLSEDTGSLIFGTMIKKGELNLVSPTKAEEQITAVVQSNLPLTSQTMERVDLKKELLSNYHNNVWIPASKDFAKHLISTNTAPDLSDMNHALATGDFSKMEPLKAVIALHDTQEVANKMDIPLEKQNILTEETSKRMATFLSNPDNLEDTKKYFKNSINAIGEVGTSAAINQVIQDNKNVDDLWNFAGVFINDPVGFESTINVLKNKKRIDTFIFENPDIITTLMNKLAVVDVSPLVGALKGSGYQGSNIDAAILSKKAVRYNALNLAFIEGVFTPENLDKALEASATMLNRKFAYLPDTKISFPKDAVADDEIEDIDSFLWHTKGRSIVANKVGLPSNISEKEKFTTEKFLDQVIDDGGFVAAVKDGKNGVKLRLPLVYKGIKAGLGIATLVDRITRQEFFMSLDDIRNEMKLNPEYKGTFKKYFRKNFVDINRNPPVLNNNADAKDNFRNKQK